MNIIEYIKKQKRTNNIRREFRRKNSHNEMTLANTVNIDRIQIGSFSYGRLRLSVFDSGNDLLIKIGNFCSIAPDVNFICGGAHHTEYLLSYPVGVKMLSKSDDSISHGPIVLEDDVWISTGATVLSGVRIGKGAVVAAGAMVTKDVPPYAVVGGVPAKIIKYRFSPDVIKRLMKIDFSKIDKETVKSNQELFTKPFDFGMLDKLEEIIKQGK